MNPVEHEILTKDHNKEKKSKKKRDASVYKPNKQSREIFFHRFPSSYQKNSFFNGEKAVWNFLFEIGYFFLGIFGVLIWITALVEIEPLKEEEISFSLDFFISWREEPVFIWIFFSTLLVFIIFWSWKFRKREAPVSPRKAHQIRNARRGFLTKKLRRPFNGRLLEIFFQTISTCSFWSVLIVASLLDSWGESSCWEMQISSFCAMVISIISRPLSLLFPCARTSFVVIHSWSSSTIFKLVSFVSQERVSSRGGVGSESSAFSFVWEDSFSHTGRMFDFVPSISANRFESSNMRFGKNSWFPIFISAPFVSGMSSFSSISTGDFVIASISCGSSSLIDTRGVLDSGGILTFWIFSWVVSSDIFWSLFTTSCFVVCNEIADQNVSFFREIFTGEGFWTVFEEIELVPCHWEVTPPDFLNPAREIFVRDSIFSVEVVFDGEEVWVCGIDGVIQTPFPDGIGTVVSRFCFWSDERSRVTMEQKIHHHSTTYFLGSQKSYPMIHLSNKRFLRFLIDKMYFFCTYRIS